MLPTSDRFTLYLSKEGDSLDIRNFWTASTIPEQAEALACKTHEQVLDFLNKIKNSENLNLLTFYHQHNTCYNKHMGTWPKGEAHSCSLDMQISFVTYKILEQQHGSRQEPKAIWNLIFG